MLIFLINKHKTGGCVLSTTHCASHIACQRYGPPAVHLLADGAGVPETSGILKTVEGSM